MGRAPAAIRMRAASIVTALPVPLSWAPCEPGPSQESRCAERITTSSGSSLPRISAIVSKTGIGPSTKQWSRSTSASTGCPAASQPWISSKSVRRIVTETSLGSSAIDSSRQFRLPPVTTRSLRLPTMRPAIGPARTSCSTCSRSSRAALSASLSSDGGRRRREDSERIQAPARRPPSASSSARVVGMASTLPRTGPSVPALQAAEVNSSSRSSGSTTRTEEGPRSKPTGTSPHLNRWQLESPRRENSSRVHMLAYSRRVEPVRRGPMLSARCSSVRHTWLFSLPSCTMRCTTSGSVWAGARPQRRSEGTRSRERRKWVMIAGVGGDRGGRSRPPQRSPSGGPAVVPAAPEGSERHWRKATRWSTSASESSSGRMSGLRAGLGLPPRR